MADGSLRAESFSTNDDDEAVYVDIEELHTNVQRIDVEARRK